MLSFAITHTWTHTGLEHAAAARGACQFLPFSAPQHQTTVLRKRFEKREQVVQVLDFLVRY